MINKKYSFKAFPYHRLSFKDRPASEFNNTIIRGSCFYQEWLEGDAEVAKDIFPDGMVGVVFEKCNLDNVRIPLGNTVAGGCNKKIRIQNDLEDWILDDDLKPIEPMDKDWRVKDGRSIDSKDIPAECIRKEKLSKAVWDVTYGKGAIPRKSWFKEVPQIIKVETRKFVKDILKSKWDKMVASNDFSEYKSKPKDVTSEYVKRGNIVVGLVVIEGEEEIYTIQGKGWLTIRKGDL